MKNVPNTTLNSRDQNTDPSVVSVERHTLTIDEEECTLVVFKNRDTDKDLFFAQQTISLLKMLQATVSHDMAGPLSLISSYSEVLEKMPQFSPKVDKQGRQRDSYEGNILKQIRSASKFARMKFKDLLDASRLENNNFFLNERRFNVRSIIGEVVGLLDSQATAQQVRIE